MRTGARRETPFTDPARTYGTALRRAGRLARSSNAPAPCPASADRHARRRHRRDHTLLSRDGTGFIPPSSRPTALTGTLEPAHADSGARPSSREPPSLDQPPKRQHHGLAENGLAVRRGGQRDPTVHLPGASLTQRSTWPTFAICPCVPTSRATRRTDGRPWEQCVDGACRHGEEGGNSVGNRRGHGERVPPSVESKELRGETKIRKGHRGDALRSRYPPVGGRIGRHVIRRRGSRLGGVASPRPDRGGGPDAYRPGDRGTCPW